MRRIRNQPGNQRQMSPNGPLLTNHLRDLDIELELLKRKREIIEQKQDILNRERYSTKRQYDYNPTNSYDCQEPYGFSQQYEGSSNSGNYRPQGVKRQAGTQNYPWNAKRFNAPQVNPWQMGSSNDFSQERHFQPFQNQAVQFSVPMPAPLMSLKPLGAPPRPQKKFQSSAPRKNFHPTKVTKPKSAQASQAPNKLGSYPAEKTKKLVNNAMKAIDKKPDPDQILRADRTPSAQLKGRLELALGIIMKQIKLEQSTEPADLEYFLTPFVQRLLKHTVRTRIRNVMMDKYVGVANDIVAAYRRHYPEETDRQLISVAKDAKVLGTSQLATIQLVDADDPEEFFKKNMTNVLTTKLEDMFTKLEKLYNKEPTNLDEYINKLPEPNTEKEKNPEEAPAPKPLTIEEVCGEDGSLSVLKEKISKTKFYTNVMDMLIEERLPKIIPKFKNHLFSIVFSEKEFLGTKAMITAQLKRKILKTIEKDESYLIHNKKVVSEKPGNEAVSTEAPTIENIDTNTEPAANDVKTESKLSQENTTDEANDAKNEINADNKEKIKSEPKAIKTEKPMTIEEPKAQSEEKPVCDITPVQETPNKTPATSPQTPKTAASKDIHYVKLIGRPTLPARAVIYNFLTKFNPQSIKKHKSISNLLVIGFNDKDNFNKILEANDSVVGESTIIIKASEQVNATKSTPSQAKVGVSPNKTKSLNESSLEDSYILGADLESQITELLTSIKKSEEVVSVNKGKDDNEEESTTEDVVKINDGNNAEKNDTNNVSSESTENIEKSENNKTKNNDANKENGDGTEISTNGNDGTKSDENRDTPDEKIDTTNGQNAETETQKSVESMDTDKELKPIQESDDKATKESSQDCEEISQKLEDKSKANVKETGRPATPTRSSSRLANSTPSTIRTRRTSRFQ